MKQRFSTCHIFVQLPTIWCRYQLLYSSLCPAYVYASFFVFCFVFLFRVFVFVLFYFVSFRFVLFCFVLLKCGTVLSNINISPSSSGPYQARTYHRGFVMLDSITLLSSNGHIFRVTDPLCGESTGHWWIPHTKASDAELWCLFVFYLSLHKQLSKQSWGCLLETKPCFT